MVVTTVVVTTTIMDIDIEMDIIITMEIDTIMVVNIELKMDVMDIIQVRTTTIIDTELKEITLQLDQDHKQEIEITTQTNVIQEEILQDQEQHVLQDHVVVHIDDNTLSLPTTTVEKRKHFT